MVKDPAEILFQDCQFFVYKAILITLDKLSRIDYGIRIANCLFSETTQHQRKSLDRIIDANKKVLVKVWNVTVHMNNTNYTSGNEEFHRYLGDVIIMRKSYFASGITLTSFIYM